MKIRLCQNECDNGKLTCIGCVHYESGDDSVGLNEGCTHPILYDEDGNIIDDIEVLILDCLSNPKHCILMERDKINFSMGDWLTYIMLLWMKLKISIKI